MCRMQAVDMLQVSYLCFCRSMASVCNRLMQSVIIADAGQCWTAAVSRPQKVVSAPALLSAPSLYTEARQKSFSLFCCALSSAMRASSPTLSGICRSCSTSPAA